MKISVVVPSYNQARYLPATLDSLFSQESVDLEVIVKDGGSTDGSVDILRQRPESFRWTSQRDGGQTAAINSGLHEATGEIFAYLNSDDIYLPGALSAVAKHFEDNKDCQLLYGDAYHLRADGSVLETYVTEDWDYERLLHVCFLCQPAVFWRRSVAERYGLFDERLNFAMDYEYWLRLGYAFPFSRLKGVYLAGSRLHEETKTLGQRVKVHREIVRVVQRYSERPHALYHWLKNLASVSVNQQGLLPSSDPKTHFDHVRAFVGSILMYAEELEIHLNNAFVTELTTLFSNAERIAAS